MTTSAPSRETENPYLNGNYAPVRVPHGFHGNWVPTEG